MKVMISSVRFLSLAFMKKAMDKNIFTENEINLLFSFALEKKPKKIIQLHDWLHAHYPQYTLNVFLDSGAFSVWTRGEKVNIDEYIQYVKSVSDNMPILGFANLDMLPGKFGVPVTQRDVEESSLQGMLNFHYMKSRGLSPVHIFHQGESFNVLDVLCKNGDYIGISPNNSESSSNKMAWLDEVFEHITDDEGNAKIKTHGFAATGQEMMAKYPWYTVDSASPFIETSFFNVITPLGLFCISKKIKDKPIHFNLQDITTKNAVLDYIKQSGFDPDISKWDNSTLSIFNCKFYTDSQLRLNQSPIRYDKTSQRLFGTTNLLTHF